jgi:hypothetical protein
MAGKYPILVVSIAQLCSLLDIGQKQSVQVEGKAHCNWSWPVGRGSPPDAHHQHGRRFPCSGPLVFIDGRPFPKHLG